MSETVFKLAILTISDSGAKGERAQDASGDAISEMMAKEGYAQVFRDIVPDEKDLISAKLREWADSHEVDVIVTTGGTGLSPRDVTPEATRAVLDLDIPGIAEAMRIQTLKNTPFAMLSRSVAGVRSGALIINLPGSPKGVRECLEVAMPAIPHALQMIRGWRGHPAQPPS
ncbi:MAG: MogA/MoaB family molybdenum cofactor biosynthesis protein [Chloroflexi bacterium]|nr:MogA/MoaB family molybdenum cofactor biosynthesis protein [Chloroflexota bacterium]